MTGRPTPFFVVAGFLGSGKTTLLKNFLAVHAGGKKIAVVQNEFAPGSIDGRELLATGLRFNILEINNGSVFCVCLLAGFIRSLAALLDSDGFDAVVFEASGLSDPIALAQMIEADVLRGRLFLVHTWCVADASSFPRMERVVLPVARQVRVADTVIINKTDLASADDIRKTGERVREINPLARRIETSYCRVALDDAFAPLTAEPVALRTRDENAQFEACGRPALGSAALRSHRTITRAGLDLFLKEVATNLFRLKGFVRLEGGGTVSVQFSSGVLEILPAASGTEATELVAIGPGLDARTFRRSFNAFTSS